MMGAVTTHATPEPDSVREDGALDRPEPDAAPSLPSAEPLSPAGADDAMPQPWRPSRRLIVLLTILAVVVAVIVAAATVPINMVIEAPGPTWNVLGSADADGSQGSDGQSSVINVTGARTYPADGALRMTTVSVRGCPGFPVTTLDVILAWFDDDKTVVDRNTVCPESMSAQEVEQVNQAQMTSSQDAAVVAALMETGLATRMVLQVEGLAEEQTSTEIQVGDILTSIAPEGGPTTQVTDFSQLRALLTTIPPGTRVTLGVERDGAAVEAHLTTIVPKDADGDGNPDSEGSLLGLVLSARADSDIDATFGLQDVGGPSAGSMFALGIVDSLTPGDLTGGKDIAGTGTIAIDGQVGAIGGIRQKMAGARAAGSDYFLAPASNCSEVVGHEPRGMEVFAVSTLHEAVGAVEAIAAGDTSGLATCETVVAAPSS